MRWGLDCSSRARLLETALVKRGQQALCWPHKALSAPYTPVLSSITRMSLCFVLWLSWRVWLDKGTNHRILELEEAFETKEFTVFIFIGEGIWPREGKWPRPVPRPPDFWHSLVHPHWSLTTGQLWKMAARLHCSWQMLPWVVSSRPKASSLHLTLLALPFENGQGSPFQEDDLYHETWRNHNAKKEEEGSGQRNLHVQMSWGRRSLMCGGTERSVQWEQSRERRILAHMQ